MPKRIYVEFVSPGTFFCETSREPIESKDTVRATQMALDVTERYGAKPFGFQFVTMMEADDIMGDDGEPLHVEPREIERSGTYYITGTLRRYHDIPDTQENSILLGNMRGNRYPIVIENRNSFRFTGPFYEKDFIVSRDGVIVTRGDEIGLQEYRESTNAEFEAYWEAFRAEYSKAD